MKKILVTQHVDIDPHHQEWRDTLDQRWYPFLLEAGLVPIVAPNHIAITRQLLSEIKIDGVLFTGGNDLVILGGEHPERDQLEHWLLQYVIQANIPLLGVCRGMEMIQSFFHTRLEPVTGHAHVQVHLKFAPGEHCLSKHRDIVNSYHRFGSRQGSDELMILARSEDEVIKAVKHTSKNILGIMWHPERYDELQADDLILFQEHFQDNCVA